MTLNNKNKATKTQNVITIDNNAKRVLDTLKEKAAKNGPYKFDTKRAVSSLICEHLGGVNV